MEMFSKLCFICLTLALSFTSTKSNDVQQQQTTSESEEDAAFQAFTWVAIRNFPDWLSSRDPSTPISDEIELKSDKRIDDAVDLDLKLISQRITGYSKTTESVFTTISEMKGNIFHVSRAASTNESYVLEGTYKANGTLQVANKDVNFTGSGIWRLTSNETFEYTIYKYTVTEDDYIQLEAAPGHRLFDINWTLIDFEGLEISAGGVQIEDNILMNEAESRIKNVLGIVYKRFLNSFNLFPPSSNPPQFLQFQYLTEVFSDIKLSEIISRYTPTTTTPSGDGSEKGGSWAILGNVTIIILLQIIYHCFK